MNIAFFDNLQTLIRQSKIKIDRQKGSQHPRYPDYIYPHDYGYLTNTTSTDRAEIDCWVGSLETDLKEVTGIIVTLDLAKRDSEIKILINCTEEDMEEILECHQRGDMCGMLIKKQEYQH